jgi:hypothetical protein
VLSKAHLIGEVATLARDMERFYAKKELMREMSHPDLVRSFLATSATDIENEGQEVTSLTTKNILDDVDGISREVNSMSPDNNDNKQSIQSEAESLNLRENVLHGHDLNDSTRIKLEEILGAFEEPESAGRSENVSVRFFDISVLLQWVDLTILDILQEEAKIADIIQFRQALSFVNTAFPFSLAFGAADTRENCIKSCEKVFHRLLSNGKDTDGILRFDTLALLAIHSDGILDETKLKDLVRLFRPDREGTLTLVDFAKSVDSVYKDIRLLRANVNNSSRLDGAFERIFHVFFYAILACICLAILGINPLVLFASISGFILGFSFMIGNACSRIVDGVLLILVRRPYDIGDRIAISDVNSDPDSSGSASWAVKGK